MEALWAEGGTKLPPTLEVGVVRGEGNPKARAKAKCWEPRLGFGLRPGTVTLVLLVLDPPGGPWPWSLQAALASPGLPNTHIHP